jgi:phosphoglucosamine mutase
VPSAGLGRARRIDDADGRYIEFCKSTFPFEMDLRGLKIVVDCANGAAYHIAPHVFHELGAEVTSIGTEPNGLNINQDVGATAPAALREAVVAQGADLGIALDGDADRVMMVDASAISTMGINCCSRWCAAVSAKGRGRCRWHLDEQSRLSMRWLNSRCLSSCQCRRPLRDGHAEAERVGFMAGKTRGTFSASTGTPPVMASFPPCRCFLHCGKKAAICNNCSGSLKLYPQKLINVALSKGFPWKDHPLIGATQQRGGERTQWLWASTPACFGTEPLLRVMVEGQDSATVTLAAEKLAAAVREAVSS